jgi:hypothetical protein
MRPTVALPTGPFDWYPERIAQNTFEARLAALRFEMNRHGITHLVVHGNVFDHDALTWLTHFTPKLGPAYALVPAKGPLQLLFSGGPGMKPSAQRLRRRRPLDQGDRVGRSGPSGWRRRKGDART